MSLDPMPASPAAAIRLEDAPLALGDVGAELGGRPVLEAVTLPIARGRITALVGASGAGKSTCVRHLVGLATPTRGRVLIEGRDVAAMSAEELRTEQRRMSVMLQGTSLFGCALSGSATVFENVAAPLRMRTAATEAEIDDLVRLRLHEVGLLDRAGSIVEELSAGMKRRVALARALVSGSDIVVLDDVESGLDRSHLRAVGAAIRAEQRATGATVLIVTHHAPFARELADVLAVLRGGRIEALGPPPEILADADGFAARFLSGEGVTEAELDGREAGATTRAPPRRERPSDRKVAYASAAFLLSLGALAILLVVASLYLFGVPSVAR